MEVVLVEYTSVEIKREPSLITLFSDNLNEYFNSKDYGDDLIEIIIGIICVSKNFEQFFNAGKPKYIKDAKTTKSIFTDQTHEVKKCFTYDIKLDFETFKNGTQEENNKLLAKEILSSLSILNAMKSKIKDFDAERFKADLESYFKGKGLV